MCRLILKIRRLLEDYLSTRSGHRIEVGIPQRGSKKDLVELVVKNARISFDQRFRVLHPSSHAIAESVANLLELEVFSATDRVL